MSKESFPGRKLQPSDRARLQGDARPHLVAETIIRDVLERAAAFLDAPRIILLWEDPEEPWHYVCQWSRAGLEISHQGWNTLLPRFAPPLRGTTFFCDDAGRPNPLVVYESAMGLRRWRGAPIPVSLREPLFIRAVLAAPLQCREVRSWLLWLDRPRMTTADLARARGVAAELSGQLEVLARSQPQEQATAAEERARLARDLHDGLLQSLAAIALHLEDVRALVEEEPHTAQKRLQTLQGLIAAEQWHLRGFIRRLKPGANPEPEGQLAARLELLARRVELEWGISVDLGSVPLDDTVNAAVAEEVYYLVSEALANAARHARASTVRVELELTPIQIRIVVTDNGRGFSFRGHYDDAALRARGLGPRTLRERLASMGGGLTIDSGDAGTILHMEVPRVPMATGGRHGD